MSPTPARKYHCRRSEPQEDRLNAMAAYTPMFCLTIIAAPHASPASNSHVPLVRAAWR